MRYCTECRSRLPDDALSCPADGRSTWAVAHDSEALGREFGDRYALLEPVAEGGASFVYRAVDLRHGRAVALKVLRPMDSVDEKRFDRELRVGGHLTSPHTVRVLDSGVSRAGERFIAMELIEGRSLAAEIAAGEAPMAPGRAVHIAAQVLDSLAEAHAAGIVHRDVKPGNILLTRAADGRDFVTLVDFGIARSVADARVTTRGIVVGTPAYMSPEQCRGEDVDARTDLYSVGAVLFEMLTGQLPHDHASSLQLMILKLTRPAPAIREVLPESLASDKLERLVARLLSIEPAGRPASAAEVSGQLDPDAESWARPQRASSRHLTAAPASRATRRVRTTAGAPDVALVRLAEALAILEANLDALRDAAAREQDPLSSKLLVKLAQHERSLVATLRQACADLGYGESLPSLTDSLARAGVDETFSRLLGEVRRPVTRGQHKGVRGVLRAALAARLRIAEFWDARLARASDPREAEVVRRLEEQSREELKRFEDLADRLGVGRGGETGPVTGVPVEALLSAVSEDITVDSAFEIPREVETGIPAIDAQHRQLFAIAKTLLASGDHARHVELRTRVLPYLASYVKYHFEAEEAVMGFLSYPGVEEHRRRHDRFRDSMGRLEELAARDGVGPSVRKRLTLFLALLVHHIRGEDRALAEFLVRAGPEAGLGPELMEGAGVGEPPSPP